MCDSRVRGVERDPTDRRSARTVTDASSVSRHAGRITHGRVPVIVASTRGGSTRCRRHDRRGRFVSERVRTTATQALLGTRLTTGGQTDCGRTVREGDRVGVYATQARETPAFAIERVICRDCRTTAIAHPTPNATELLVHGRLAVTTDAASREARLTLRDPDSRRTHRRRHERVIGASDADGRLTRAAQARERPTMSAHTDRTRRDPAQR